MTPPNNEGVNATNDYYYGVDGVPYCGEIVAATGLEELRLENARPGYKFIVYEVQENEDKSLVKRFAVCDITQDLIKYPCEVRVGITTGSGVLNTVPITIVNYGEDYVASVKPDKGWDIESVEITFADGSTNKLTKEGLTQNGNNYIITLSKVIQDANISVSFTSGAL